MTIVQEIIAEHYPDISRNTDNGKVVIKGKKLPEYIISAITDLYFDRTGAKIPKTKVKEEVEIYADAHPVTSGSKQKQQKQFQSWATGIEFDDSGMPLKTLQNTIEFFTKHPNYSTAFTFNEFTQFENYNGRPIEDWMMVDFRHDCENVMGYNTRDLVESAVILACHRNSFDPFKDAINKLVWDGIERVDTFFIKYIGAEDTPLNRSMTKKFFYAMMKRLFEPGCDFDNMLIVADPTQGTGKTKILMRFPKALGIPYGCDTTLSCDPKDKDNVDKLNRCWIAIIDELTSFLKKDPETTKQFLSQSTDIARLSYARRSQMFNRHNVFYATTNQDYFLKDYASEFERRYWIMDCHGTAHDAEWWDTNLPDSEVLQVMAEAYKFYLDNPSFKYTELSLDEQKELLQVQRRHKTMCNDDVLQDQILRVINLPMRETVFNDAKEFMTAMRSAENSVTPYDRTADEFLGLAGEQVTEYKQIESVPSSWLREWIKTDLRRDVSAGYLSQLLGEEFDYEPKGHYKDKEGKWKSTSTFTRK